MWDIIHGSSWHEKTVVTLKKDAEELLQKPIEAVKYHEFKLFRENGNRSVYETSYFARRQRLNKFAVLSMLFDERKYIEALEDIIWAICDEYTWSVVAHLPFDLPTSEFRTWIDLFASETGFALSEICYLLEDKLSQQIKDRIKHEVHERIILSFLNKQDKYYWESITNNWAAVCCGSVGVAFMYQATKNEFEKALPRLLNGMDSFLSGYGGDGACAEGGGYWSYGFSFFLCFAEMLRRYTNGEKDLLSSEKVEKIARFQQIMMLKDHKVANFSDCHDQYSFHIGITHFLAKEYKDIIVPPMEDAADFNSDRCYRWGINIRDFLWADKNIQTTKETEKYYYLPDAAWYINTNKKYAFAAKAGHNGESHNHNDIGSFIFITGDDTIAAELGMGEYNHAYFGPQRYEFLTNGSQGHSVPIINGVYQKDGEEFCSELLHQDEKEFSFDMAKAYPLPTLKTLKRTFSILDDGVVLTDQFEIENNVDSITERIISHIQPVVKENEVLFNDGKIVFDDKQLECKINSETYSGHGTNPITAYLIDFIVKNPQANMVCTLKFSNK